MADSAFVGHNGQIVLEDGALTIERKGALGFITQGLKGSKRIPYSSITSVQFKHAGLINGYIQFAVSGGQESRRGVIDATSDENTVMFRKSQEDDFLAVKEYVEKRIESRGTNQALDATSGSSYAEELTRLGDLLDRNLITREEFDQEKSRLQVGRTSTATAPQIPSNNTGTRLASAGESYESEEHEMTPALGVGIFFLPIVFSWFTLRNGYSGLARGVSIAWLIISLAMCSAIGSSDKESSEDPTPPKPTTVETIKPAAVGPSPTNWQATQASSQQNFLGAEVAAYDQVEAITLRYRQLYQQASNDIQRTELRFARGQELCKIQAPKYVTRVQLNSLTTSKNGDATVSFKTLSGTELYPNETYARGTAEHSLLGAMAPGSTVTLSFTFDVDDTGKDCFHSHRWTEVNNMTKPQWDIKVLNMAP